MAPELLEGKRYTNKVDVFSFGMCIWETIVRRRPSAGQTGMVARAIKARRDAEAEKEKKKNTLPLWMK